MYPVDSEHGKQTRADMDVLVGAILADVSSLGSALCAGYYGPLSKRAALVSARLSDNHR